MIDTAWDAVLIDYKVRALNRSHDVITPLLDVGCGSGDLLYKLRGDVIRTPREFLGIEIDPKKAVNANKLLAIPEKFNDLQDNEDAVFCGDFLTYDFDDRRFHTIVAFNILEHILDLHAFMQKCHSLLSRDGRLIIGVPNARSLHKRVGDFAGISSPYVLTEADHNKGHRHTFDMEMLSDLFTRCSFEVYKTFGIILKPLPGRDMLNLDEKVLDGFYKLGFDYPELCGLIVVVGGKK